MVEKLGAIPSEEMAVLGDSANFSLAVALFGSLAFILGVIAESKKFAALGRLMLATGTMARDDDCCLVLTDGGDNMAEEIDDSFYLMSIMTKFYHVEDGDLEGEGWASTILKGHGCIGASAIV